MSNHAHHNVSDELSCPFPYFKGAAVDIEVIPVCLTYVMNIAYFLPGQIGTNGIDTSCGEQNGHLTVCSFLQTNFI